MVQVVTAAGEAVWITAVPWQLESVQSPAPTSDAVWHLLHVAGTAGLSMPLWHVVHVVMPSWLTLSEACAPLWHEAQSLMSGSVPPWCGLLPGSVADLLTAWHVVQGAESAPACGLVPWEKVRKCVAA